VSACREGYVKPVVDQDSGSVRPGSLDYGAHELLQPLCGEVWLAHLHKIDSPGCSLANELQLRTVVWPVRTVAERQSICDQVQQQGV
jgi:hypothetical protein